MNQTNQEPAQSSEVPEALRPSENYADWRVCLRPDVLRLADGFSRQFRLTPEEGVASLLTSVGHALGESLQVALPHGNISPPFSWLAITADREPIWTGTLLRYLRTGIEEQVEHQLCNQQARADRNAGTDKGAEEANDPAKRIERLSEAAGLRVLRCIVDTITRDNPKPPFDRPPIDRAVSLVTPPGGLLRSLSRLSKLELIGLEEALTGVRFSPQRNGNCVLEARPSFIWQVPEADASAFFRQHGEWILQVPFLVTRGERPSFPCIDTKASALSQFDRLTELLFNERHARHGNPRVCHIDAKTGKPIMKFLNEAGKWQASTQNGYPMRWVADLGVKFSLSLMRLEEEKALTARLVESGLELAKFFARRRIELLSATGWNSSAENTETADLSIEERRCYLKICESGAMTKAELRRSCHEMAASERDRIVAKLLSQKLIRHDGKFLRQNAA